MWEDGLLGPGDYEIFKDWLAIDRSRDGYVRIRDGLVSDGEVQEMNDEKNFYDEEPYKVRVCAFSWRTTLSPVALVPPDGLGACCKFEMSLVRVMFFAHLLISFVLMDRKFSFGTRIRQV
jgi:hypothetical protein